MHKQNPGRLSTFWEQSSRTTAALYRNYQIQKIFQKTPLIEIRAFAGLRRQKIAINYLPLNELLSTLPIHNPTPIREHFIEHRLNKSTALPLKISVQDYFCAPKNRFLTCLFTLP